MPSTASLIWSPFGPAIEGIDTDYKSDILDEVDDIYRITDATSLSDDGTVVAVLFTEVLVDQLTNTSWREDRHRFLRVYKYDTPTNQWLQMGQDFDYGSSVSISGDGSFLAIGDTINSRVQVFWYNSTADVNAWTQVGEDMSYETNKTYQLFGVSVSLSRDASTVAVGALQADINYTNDGFVRVYRFHDATHAWTVLAEDIVGEDYNDQSGSSVCLSSDGNILAIAAKYNDGEVSYQDAVGHVRVYQYRNDTDVWTQLGKDIDGLASWELSGSSVALSGDGLVVAISAPSADSWNAPCIYNTGLVRVFHYNTTADTWLQVGRSIYGESCGDESGDSISLSSNGDIVAIGAVQNDGTNSDWMTNSGHVRIFQYSSSTNVWIQLGMEIDGTPGAHYGKQVSLDASGKTVAVGTSGDIRVYRLGTDFVIR
jgi:hypothetical protein